MGKLSNFVTQLSPVLRFFATALIGLYIVSTVNLLSLQRSEYNAARHAITQNNRDQALFQLGQCLRHASIWTRWTRDCELQAGELIVQDKHYSDYILHAPDSSKTDFNNLDQPTTLIDPKPLWSIVLHLGFAGFLLLTFMQIHFKHLTGRLALTHKACWALSLTLWLLGGWFA